MTTRKTVPFDPKKYKFSLEQVANHFGYNTAASFKTSYQLKAEESGDLKRTEIGSVYKIKDPNSNRHLYSQAYIDLVTEARKKANFKTREKRGSSVAKTKKIVKSQSRVISTLNKADILKTIGDKIAAFERKQQMELQEFLKKLKG